jgi:hypothetical protein
MATPARRLAPPRAAAIAGVAFSVLMSTSLVVIRLAVPAHQTNPGEWVNDPFRRNAVRFALQLAPFAGIAFLWFMGVVRNRLGDIEDKFFATVFLGSGLLFVVSLFASAVLAGAVLDTISGGDTQLAGSEAFLLVRQVIRAAMNVFAIKMAGMFIFSTSTIVLRTGILPRWVAFLGFLCGSVLLLVITSWPWIALLFPLWMLLVSVHIFLGEFRGHREATT